MEVESVKIRAFIGVRLRDSDTRRYRNSTIIGKFILHSQSVFLYIILRLTPVGTGITSMISIFEAHK